MGINDVESTVGYELHKFVKFSTHDVSKLLCFFSIDAVTDRHLLNDYTEELWI